MPPADRIWWKVPVGRQEIIWIAIALVWCLIMFFMMPYWHIYGKQNLSNEAYQTTPAKFGAKVQAGEYGIVCNEYCGIGHHLMVGKIYVKE